MNDILKEAYYNPESGLFGAQTLYERLKEKYPSLKLSTVKEFIRKQEANQITNQRDVRKSNYYPLVSYLPFSRLQMDLLDLIDSVPKTNRGYRYIFLFIDVYSRFVYAIPIKTKTEKELCKVLKDVLSKINQRGFIVSQLDSDNETSFLSNNFQKILEENGIKSNLSQVGDHHSLGIIDRFCRTLRDVLKRYSIAYNTNNWIDVIDKIIHNYNNKIHSTLGDTPENVIKKDNTSDVYQRLEKRINKADEAYFNRTSFQVGDKVRLLLKKGIFEKGTERWSRTIHKVEKVDGIYYYVSDRKSPYKKSELQDATDSESRPDVIDDESVQEVREERKKRRTNRRIRKEGVDEKDITTDDNLSRATRRYRKARDLGPVIQDI